MPQPTRAKDARSASKTKPGKATKEKTAREFARRRPSRYTPPTPRGQRHSPRWYPWLLLGLAVAGIGVIIANYSSALPGSPTNWYTLGSLIALLAAALLATGYR